MVIKSYPSSTKTPSCFKLAIVIAILLDSLIRWLAMSKIVSRSRGEFRTCFESMNTAMVMKVSVQALKLSRSSVYWIDRS